MMNNLGPKLGRNMIVRQTPKNVLAHKVTHSSAAAAKTITEGVDLSKGHRVIDGPDTKTTKIHSKGPAARYHGG
jgi:hypothetical protein